MAALELLMGQPRLVERLQRNAEVLRHGLAQEGLDTGRSRSHIIPLVLGEPERALAASRRALEGGVFAQAIRPPTVPAGTSRLRLAVMASHSKAELRSAARTLGEVARPLERPFTAEPVEPPARDGLAEAA
jgi:glycine C-acetyltransferase/8-amino-7-oxononanoate synthase